MCWCNPSIRTFCCGGPNCHPPRGIAVERLKIELEDRLSDVLEKARDYQGRKVRLYRGEHSAANLRITTQEFAQLGTDGDNIHIPGLMDPKANPEAYRLAQAEAEASYWDNLALLARATAAAIRVEAQRA